MKQKTVAVILGASVFGLLMVAIFPRTASEQLAQNEVNSIESAQLVAQAGSFDDFGEDFQQNGRDQFANQRRGSFREFLGASFQLTPGAWEGAGISAWEGNPNAFQEYCQNSPFIECEPGQIEATVEGGPFGDSEESQALLDELLEDFFGENPQDFDVDTDPYSFTSGYRSRLMFRKGLIENFHLGILLIRDIANGALAAGYDTTPVLDMIADFDSYVLNANASLSTAEGIISSWLLFSAVTEPSADDTAAFNEELQFEFDEIRRNLAEAFLIQQMARIELDAILIDGVTIYDFMSNDPFANADPAIATQDSMNQVIEAIQSYQNTSF